MIITQMIVSLNTGQMNCSLKLHSNNVKNHYNNDDYNSDDRVSEHWADELQSQVT